MDCTQALDDFSFEDTEHFKAGEKKQVGSLEIRGVKHPIYSGENRIGRDASCSVSVSSKALSKEHAVIDIVSVDSHLIYDLGSRNKTRLGKMVLQPQVRYQLQDGAKLYLADVSAVYRRHTSNLDVDDDSGSETGSESMLNINNSVVEDTVIVPETPGPSRIKPKNAFTIEESPSSASDVDNSFGFNNTIESVELKINKLSEVLSDKKKDKKQMEKNQNEEDVSIYEAETQCVVDTSLIKSSANKHLQVSNKPQGSKDCADVTGQEDLFEEETQCEETCFKVPDKSLETEDRKEKDLISIAVSNKEEVEPTKVDLHHNNEDDIYTAETQCEMDDCQDVKNKDVSKVDDIYDAPTQCFLGDTGVEKIFADKTDTASVSSERTEEYIYDESSVSSHEDVNMKQLEGKVNTVDINISTETKTVDSEGGKIDSKIFSGKLPSSSKDDQSRKHSDVQNKEGRSAISKSASNVSFNEDKFDRSLLEGDDDFFTFGTSQAKNSKETTSQMNKDSEKFNEKGKESVDMESALNKTLHKGMSGQCTVPPLESDKVNVSSPEVSTSLATNKCTANKSLLVKSQNNSRGKTNLDNTCNSKTPNVPSDKSSKNIANLSEHSTNKDSSNAPSTSKIARMSTHVSNESENDTDQDIFDAKTQNILSPNKSIQNIAKSSNSFKPTPSLISNNNSKLPAESHNDSGNETDPDDIFEANTQKLLSPNSKDDAKQSGASTRKDPSKSYTNTSALSKSGIKKVTQLPVSNKLDEDQDSIYEAQTQILKSPKTNEREVVKHCDTSRKDIANTLATMGDNSAAEANDIFEAATQQIEAPKGKETSNLLAASNNDNKKSCMQVQNAFPDEDEDIFEAATQILEIPPRSSKALTNTSDVPTKIGTMSALTVKNNDKVKLLDNFLKDDKEKQSVSVDDEAVDSIFDAPTQIVETSTTGSKEPIKTSELPPGKGNLDIQENIPSPNSNSTFKAVKISTSAGNTHGDKYLNLQTHRVGNVNKDNKDLNKDTHYSNTTSHMSNSTCADSKKLLPIGSAHSKGNHPIPETSPQKAGTSTNGSKGLGKVYTDIGEDVDNDDFFDAPTQRIDENTFRKPLTVDRADMILKLHSKNETNTKQPVDKNSKPAVKLNVESNRAGSSKEERCKGNIQGTEKLVVHRISNIDSNIKHPTKLNVVSGGESDLEDIYNATTQELSIPCHGTTEIKENEKSGKVSTKNPRDHKFLIEGSDREKSKIANAQKGDENPGVKDPKKLADFPPKTEGAAAVANKCLVTSATLKGSNKTPEIPSVKPVVALTAQKDEKNSELCSSKMDVDVSSKSEGGINVSEIIPSEKAVFLPGGQKDSVVKSQNLVVVGTQKISGITEKEKTKKLDVLKPKAEVNRLGNSKLVTSEKVVNTTTVQKQDNECELKKVDVSNSVKDTKEKSVTELKKLNYTTASAQRDGVEKSQVEKSKLAHTKAKSSDGAPEIRKSVECLDTAGSFKKKMDVKPVISKSEKGYISIGVTGNDGKSGLTDSNKCDITIATSSKSCDGKSEIAKMKGQHNERIIAQKDGDRQRGLMGPIKLDITVSDTRRKNGGKCEMKDSKNEVDITKMLKTSGVESNKPIDVSVDSQKSDGRRIGMSESKEPDAITRASHRDSGEKSSLKQSDTAVQKDGRTIGIEESKDTMKSAPRNKNEMSETSDSIQSCDNTISDQDSDRKSKVEESREADEVVDTQKNGNAKSVMIESKTRLTSQRGTDQKLVSLNTGLHVHKGSDKKLDLKGVNQSPDDVTKVQREGDNSEIGQSKNLDNKTPSAHWVGGAKSEMKGSNKLDAVTTQKHSGKKTVGEFKKLDDSTASVQKYDSVKLKLTETKSSVDITKDTKKAETGKHVLKDSSDPRDLSACNQKQSSEKPDISKSQKPYDVIISTESKANKVSEVSESTDSVSNIQGDSGEETDPENTFEAEVHKIKVDHSKNEALKKCAVPKLTCESDLTVTCEVKKVCVEIENTKSLEEVSLLQTSTGGKKDNDLNQPSSPLQQEEILNTIKNNKDGGADISKNKDVQDSKTEISTICEGSTPKLHSEITQQSKNGNEMGDATGQSSYEDMNDTLGLLLPSSPDLRVAVREFEAQQTPFKPEDHIYSEDEVNPSNEISKCSNLATGKARVRKRLYVGSKAPVSTVGSTRRRKQPDGESVPTSMEINNVTGTNRRRKLRDEDSVQSSNASNIPVRGSKQRRLLDRSPVHQQSKPDATDVSSRRRLRGSGEIQKSVAESINTDKENSSKGGKTKIDTTQKKLQAKPVISSGLQKDSHLKPSLESLRRERSSRSKVEKDKGKEQVTKPEETVDGKGRRGSKQMAASTKNNSSKDLVTVAVRSRRETRNANKNEDVENVPAPSSRPSRQRKMTWKVRESLGSDSSQGSVTPGEEKSKSRGSSSNNSQNEISDNLELSSSRNMRSKNNSTTKSPSKKLLKSSEDSHNDTSKDSEENKGINIGSRNVASRKSSRQNKGDTAATPTSGIPTFQSPQRITRQKDGEVVSKGQKRKNEETISEVVSKRSRREEQVLIIEKSQSSPRISRGVLNIDDISKDVNIESHTRTSGRKGRQNASVGLIREQSPATSPILTENGRRRLALEETQNSDVGSVQSIKVRNVRKKPEVFVNSPSCLKELNTTISGASSRPQRGTKRTRTNVEEEIERLPTKHSKYENRMLQSHMPSFDCNTQNNTTESVQPTRASRTRSKVTPPQNSSTIKQDTKSQKASSNVANSTKLSQRVRSGRFTKTEAVLAELQSESGTPKSSEDQITTPQRPRSSRGRGTQQNTSQNSTPQNINKSGVSTPRRSTPRKGATSGATTYQVLFTGFTDSKQESIVKELGGSVVDLPESCTVLVTDKVRRTYKFLCIMGQGKPIVSPEWLIRCRRSGCFLDPWQFLIKDQESESKFKFQLQDSLEAAARTNLLLGYSVHVTSKVKPPPTEMRGIIESCGGVYMTQAPTKLWPANSFIISCMDDKASWSRLKKSGKAVVGPETLLLGVLQQKLDLKSNTLV